jgi:hypothetical protein
MTETKTDPKLTGVALVAALIVLAAWLVLLSWLAFHTAATELQWARLGSVLGSLEAVAFAAAGALFGTTVQNQRVQEAKERAGKAEDRATHAEKTSTEHVQAAANGRALAVAVKARAGTRAAMRGIERVTAAEGSEDVTDDLAALATKLFPD